MRQTDAELARHQREIEANLEHWRRKTCLRRIYREFYELIARNLAGLQGGLVVELGSGIGSIREVIPQCLRTDVFPNPWIDRVENAYALSFADGTVSDLILFDVFHHLRYPGTALAEFWRVLMPEGRVILFEPCLSVLGLIAYGTFHDEPLRLKEPIEWLAPRGWSADQAGYYAAQGNASRIFLRGEFREQWKSWRLVKTRRLAALAYLGSGGYSKRQLYPDWAYPLIRGMERVADLAPALFATRLLVVLAKPYSGVMSAGAR